MKKYVLALMCLSVLSNGKAMELDPLKMTLSQPLQFAQQPIYGQWRCESIKQYAEGVQLKSVNIERYTANGQNTSNTEMQLILPYKTVNYRFSSTSNWQLLPDDILDHTNVRLTEFSVDDADIENKLKLREQILQQSNFQTKILKIDQNQVVIQALKPLDQNDAQNNVQKNSDSIQNSNLEQAITCQKVN